MKSNDKVTIAKDAKISSSCHVPEWAAMAGLEIPNVDAGDLHLEMSRDDSTFIDIGIAGTVPITISSSGDDPCFVSVTDLADLVDGYIRVVSATAQTTAAVDFYFHWSDC